MSLIGMGNALHAVLAVEQDIALQRCSAPVDPPEPQRDARQRVVTLLLPILPIVGLLIVWLLGGLERFDSPSELAEVARSVRDRPLLGFAYVMIGFGVGSALFVPITVLIGATVLTFEPVRGFCYAFVGVQLAATTTYGCGRGLGGRALDLLSGPRVERFRQLLRTRAVYASIIARLLPVGNFTLINWLVGAMRVPFRAFIAGNALGALPGLVAFTLFAGQISALLRAGGKRHVDWIALLVVSAVVVGFVVYGILRRRRQRS